MRNHRPSLAPTNCARASWLPFLIPLAGQVPHQITVIGFCDLNRGGAAKETDILSSRAKMACSPALFANWTTHAKAEHSPADKLLPRFASDLREKWQLARA